jgi:DNA-directed RNA polymerase I subunit RPA1
MSAADFDGDEMNIHFPQNEVARAEAMLIARTDNQYLVPTDGGVLRGLIQDHVDAGVDMTCRDTFLEREDYMELVYVALKPEPAFKGGGIGNGNIENEVEIGDMGKVVTLPPAIFKPRPLWTGKQVISTILLNMTYDKVQLNLKSKSRIPAKSWGGVAPEEQEVLVMNGELLTGILDKSQFGASAHGLVHAVYEIYGPPYAGRLLSVLGRLFTTYLQYVGFSCRMDDLRLTAEGDKIRKELIAKSTNIGREASSEYVGLDGEDVSDARLASRLESVLRDDEQMAGLDSAMKNKTNKITSEIIAETIPGKLLKPFPRNNMQVMTVSGAKGSGVNVSQISCLLGQQELEGRRVPTMVSGKTLPSFTAFDSSARAGGFITGRFLTGIKPQEYFFHW